MPKPKERTKKQPTKKQKPTASARATESPEGGEAPPAVPAVPAVGNTNNAGTKEKFTENPAKIWCFTVFDYSEDLLKIMCSTCSTVPEVKVDFVFGREICPDTKKPHLQCCVRFSKKMRWRTVFSGILPDSVHRKPAKGTWEQNMAYCAKDGDYCSNVNIIIPFKKKPVVLYQWQEKAIEIVKMRLLEDRKISWFYSEAGGVGKSVLVDWLVCNFQAVAISGAKRHVLATAHKLPQTPIWIFDIPRVNHNGVSYDAIESIRNGLWFSGFGDAVGMTRLDFNPVVVVFCNELPEIDKLSMDRWDIWEIHDNDIFQIDPRDV